jgi:photosystem II stability/assembly factor-like uncharacterized protein
MNWTRNVFALFASLMIIGSCQMEEAPVEKQSGAATAMEFWTQIRSYPDQIISVKPLSEAFEARQALAMQRGNGPTANWEGIGPKNIGGRTISLAFHPEDPNQIFIGSAGGGLWKTETAGVGAEAWSYIPTGFPVMGVGAIAINPDNPDEMYIGTGEVYNYNAAQPGSIIRTTRGTYGVGILKSMDGGATWTKSLDWSYADMEGVQDLLINPEHPETVYAATTQGVFRTYNSGTSWDLISDITMAVDLEMSPIDTSIIFVTHGGYNSPDRGVYRSTDGGESFQLLNGLPSNYSGKTVLSISPSNPEIIYVSAGNAFVTAGLWRSDDGGDSWTQVNNEDIPKYQGWYSHDVAIKPDNPDHIVYTGVDGFVSLDGGLTLTQTSYWYLWFFGQTPVGGPEGPPEYAHADIHGAFFHPANPNHVFLVTDGGVFFSEDAGFTWEGRNGGYQTQQFYSNFSNSHQDSSLAIGGMQDNATAIYLGDDAWYRVIGGDGMNTAINPVRDRSIWGSFQNLSIRRSYSENFNFTGINAGDWTNESRAFNGPFVITPSDTSIMYAGAQRLYRSSDGGNSWFATTTNQVDGGNVVYKIAVSEEDPELVYISTVDLNGINPPQVKKSINGGGIWLNMNGLPDRVATDIEIDPNDPNTVYVCYSGFGAPHIFKTTNGGSSWEALSEGLPDLPANSLLIDPMFPNHLYLGNDLGVYFSSDAGSSWEPFADGLPDAVFAMDLSLSPVNRKIRLATHGSGVYEADLVPEINTAISQQPVAAPHLLYPNPSDEATTLEWELSTGMEVRVIAFDQKGRSVWTHIHPGTVGKNQLVIPTREWPAGMYSLQWETTSGLQSASLVVSH